MKKITLLLFLALGTALPGCKEKIQFGGDEGDDTQTGNLVLSDLAVGVANYAEEMTSEGNTNDGTRAGSPAETTEAPGDYIVRIKNQKTGVELTYTYSELKQIDGGKIPLSLGVYVISAESPGYGDYIENGAAAGWETPVFYGSVTKVIIPKQETAVTDLVCTLANIKTTVILSQDLRDLFMSDAMAESGSQQKLSVKLSLGTAGLTFDRAKSESGAAGYFKAPAGRSTIKVELTGMYNKSAADEAPEYVPVNWEQEITDCAAGQWRKVSIGILNANEGNVKFEITVQNWVYDEKIDTDVLRMYAGFFGEEIIKEGDVTDPDSPVVSLAGGDIEAGYSIYGAMYDGELEKWNQNLKVLVTPAAGAGVATVDVTVDSDNAGLMAAVGGADTRIAVWPANAALSAYLTTRVDGSVVSATLKDAGMSEIFRYEGVHTVKYIAVDSKGRTSYTTLAITVTGADGPGPKIVWTNIDGSVTYDFSKRYKHTEVEALLTITTKSRFTDFSVDIVSDVLDESVLDVAGLTPHLDLINPGATEATLNNLGFPTGDGITSQQSVSIDITSFMGMISALRTPGTCDFILSVTDDEGTTVKTLKLDVEVAP